MDAQPHQRRKRYSGTHPRTFEEKYKEHDPLKYADTIEKVIAKGSTPAGMHLSIMVPEILNVLQIHPGMQGLDATLGYGGHTRKMADELQGKGLIYGLDVDPIESAKTKERLERDGYGDLIQVRLQNFAQIDTLAEEVGRFDFVLADLGVSSMQIDDPSRGFSYKTEGPLDLRMNPEKGIPASERIRSAGKEELAAMFRENGDEPYADKIAAAIKKGPSPKTTTELRLIIEKVYSTIPARELNGDRKEAAKKACARVFQALRIDINREFEVLFDFLEKLPGVLKPGGRAAILTFHSGEDRLVKKSFKELKNLGVYSEISEDVIRPGQEECHRNPRARSTKLRYCVRSEMAI